MSVTEDAKKWILEKTLVDRTYGARPLRRALQRYVEDPLSEALIAGGIAERPAFLEVYLENNQLFYRPVSEVGEDKSTGILLFSNYRSVYSAEGRGKSPGLLASVRVGSGAICGFFYNPMSASAETSPGYRFTHRG